MEGAACGCWGGLFTAQKTRGLLFQGCRSVWELGPWSSAWGWSTFGSRAGGGTLLRNAPPSIAFCPGLVWPWAGVGSDAAAFSCALLPPCCLHPARQGRGLCCHPERRPHPPRPLARMGLANLCGAEHCRGLVQPQPCYLSTQGPAAVPLHLSPAELALVCSPQMDTPACATRATRCTPAISAAWVCQHLL